jgi:PAS domain S-box-containing protein
MPDRFRPAHERGIERFLKTRDPHVIGQTVELVGLRNDGSEFPLELSLAAWTAGTEVFFTAIVRDITDRQQLQREIEQRRQYLESVLAYAPDAIVTLDQNGHVLEWNQGAVTLFGYAPEEAKGRDLDDLITGDHAPTIDEATRLTQQLFNGKPVQRHETVRYRRDGRSVDLMAAGSPIYVGEEMVGLVAVYTDITERKRVERALHELNASLEERVAQRTFELQVLHELTQEIGYARSYDDLFRVILQHLSRVSRFDIAASMLVTDGGWELLLWRLRPIADQLLEEIKEQALQAYEEMAGTQRPADGVVVRSYEADAFDPALPVLDSIGQHIQVPIGIGDQADGLLYIGSGSEWELDYEDLRLLYTLSNQAADSIRRLRAMLAEEQRRLERLVEHLPEGILLLDAENRITLSNPAALEILSLLGDEHEGGPSQIGPHPMERVLHKARGPVPLTITTEDPDFRAIEVSAQPLPAERPHEGGVILLLRDVTEARRIEKQMQQQDRLAAVGQLAGGIAHDFNNILTTIILYTQTCLRSPDLPQRVTHGLETTLDSAKRAADLVRQILDFSRHADMDTHPLDLRTHVEGIMRVLERTLPENIHISLAKGSDGCIVNADPTRIQQVLMNLVVNARDAMPDGGSLRVSVSQINLPPGSQPPVAGMPPGEWVSLGVADTGVGMSPEVVAHMFEPFFTTKARGEGTGLGLAQVYGIVAQHQGYIGVETQPGEGSTFTLYLPAHGAHERVALAQKSSGDMPLPVRGPAKTILLVEDERQIRELGQVILEELGYRTLVAADGEEALRVCREAGGVDLVITDMVMPRMGGKDLIEQLRQTDPNLKAVAISGYALTEDIQELRRDGIVDVLQKPFDEHTLARVIRRALEGPSEGMDSRD